MSNLSGLPPAAIAAAAARAQIQDIAVRLIALPDSLQNNPQSLNLTGTVKGQTPEGYVQVETERGIINILLKDRGNLPPGQKIEIEIPAGRPPAQAAIRPQPQNQEPAPTSQPPRLEIPTGQNSNTSHPVSSPGVKLDRPASVKQNDLAEALSSITPEENIRLSAPLAAGQIVRLIPISSMPQAAQLVQNTALMKPEELFTNLLNMIIEAIDLPIETRRNLTQLLGRIDIGALLPVPDEQIAATKQKQLETAFQKLSQALDLPISPKLQNTPLQNSTPTVFINPSKPIDVQILAFQNGNFQAALSQAQSAQALPLIAKDLVVLPQPPVNVQASTSPPALPQVTIPGNPALPISKTEISVQGQIPAYSAPAPSPIQTTPNTAPPINNQVQPNPATGLPLATPTSQPALPAQQPPTILGQVVSFTPQGQPIVALALPGSSQPVNYAVQFIANNVIEGSPVIVAPLPAVMPKPRAGFVPFAIGAGQNLQNWAQGEIWENLQNLIVSAGQINPQAAQSLIQMLPTPTQPQNMGALSLFFLAIMRSGELDALIDPPTVDFLKANNKIDILRALAGDSAMTTRLEATPLPNDWKATVIPFWYGQQVHKLPLYYKSWNEENDESVENGRRKKMRFMFELNLSRMGKVQVDGFMKQEKLDMIMRTKATISNPMQEALRKLYYKAMDRSNLSGEITFQFKPEQWVNVEIAG
ncbi:MAG: hypothetical protein DI586_01400 [Micavibrio aeruginosavorus]|uniref:Uncharacterized protein n=1 Tax=Micavibrio aeruginosavorus TaxID=349221 RepID=A0A2W5HTZ7_9BACT|nr:MAG: hypothetical protein DI586_01400 [Micavibrio aeruginosavorus]